MAAASENLSMEDAAEDAPVQPPSHVSAPTSRARAPSDERKRTAPTRVRTVRVPTVVRPELLRPLLYGERGGVRAIAQATGCSIDHCASRADEDEPRAFVMSFLVTAASSGQLEDAARQLRTLVDRVQTRVQNQAQVDARPRRAEEADRRCYPRSRRRYEEDDETEFVDAAYRPPPPFVARRRVRRYPDHPRWTPRSYAAHPRGDVGYALYAEADEQTPRPRARQPRHVYQPPSHLEFNPYEDEGGEEFPAYDDAESAGDDQEFDNVPEPVHHSRRSLKRPIGSLRSEGPPPAIYRQRVPYIYDYAYEDEDEWMTEEEEMASAYGYPPPYRHMEVPVVHRRRRVNSVSSQWSSPVGRMYKRRRIPREELSIDHEMSQEAVFESRGREHTTPPPGARVRTALLDQLDDVADRNTADTFHGGDDDPETAFVPMEDDSAVSEIRNDNYARQSEHGGSSPVNKITQAATSDEVVTEPTANLTADSSTEELSTEQENLDPNDELVQSSEKKPEVDADMQPGVAIERIAQSEVAPLIPSSPTQEIAEPTAERVAQSEVAPLIPQETAHYTSPQKSTVSSSSPARKTPNCLLGEEERRIASPSHSVASDVSHDLDNGGDSAMDCSILRNDCSEAATSVAEESNSTPTPRPMLPAAVETDVHCDIVVNGPQPIPPTTQVGSPVVSVVTDAIQINNHVIASLERMNKEEAAFEMAKSSLAAQEETYRRLESSSRCHHRLEVLCDVVYELQCQIGSHSCGLNQSRKQALLDKLDSYLEIMLTESEQSLEEKADAMEGGLKHFFAVGGLSVDEPVVKNGSKLPKPTTSAITKTIPSAGESPDKVDETTTMNWEDGDWFEEAAPIDPASESEELDGFVDHFSPKKSNSKFEGDFLAVKLEHGVTPSWPRELPPFVWSLLARVISSDPQSYVMRVTHKRLLDEIAKGDPYYYLHPTTVSNDNVVSTPQGSTSPLCEFGCRGASALKWERKLVSQISSRMKSFDNVAYSLARSSGGKEVLNRKKMNSIIRKLHLVAMQLHSLVSHLYCVKGQTTCKEVDSLPIALNNSHFERKMGVYKSRLKLVVPHKYQQQQQPPQQQPSNTNEPAEEMLRDTYEFFPELLLCVDIWGYNYREGQAKRHNSKSVLGDNYSGSRLASGLFPLGFFRGVESLAFDFEHDSNGLLRCICDELLNIVCLWNDFKWTDNLEGVALERVVSFEADVTASILKILEIYAHHLQALWAVRLLDEPEQLRSVHFTQFNAYYSDRSQGSLNSTTSSQIRSPGLSKTATRGSNTNANTVDHLVANEIVEQRLAEEYWNRKVTALSIHNSDDDEMDVDGAAKPSQLLSTETICSWDQETLVSYLLRWSDVYAVRGEVNSLSAVTNHMLKHEVQQYQLANRSTNSEAAGNSVDSAMVDTASKQLLAAVGRGQMLIRDALIGAEKLALHSASNQLPDERKYPGYEEAELVAGDASGAIQYGSDFSGEVLDPNEPNSAEESGEQEDEAASSDTETAVEQPKGSSRARSSTAVQEGTNFEVGSSSEQPELRDLIQLLAVTKQDMQELCGHRPRSARMREKVQTQSVQLARQTVEIFRNIRNMYGSQQRR